MEIEKNKTYGRAITGMLALAITIGLSRFGYGTYIYELMKINGMNVFSIGVISTANLFGYLIGCLLMSNLSRRYFKSDTMYAAIFISIVTVAVSIQATSVTLWIILRLLNGVAGGITFIIVTVSLVEKLSQCSAKRYIPIMYTGVGLGIVLAGLSALPLEIGEINSLQSTLMLQSLMGIALFTLLLLVRKNYLDMSNAHDVNGDDNIFPKRNIFKIILASYLCEGMGYIVYITYIFPHDVIQYQDLPYASYNFIALGIGSALGHLLLATVTDDKQILHWIVLLFVCQIVAIVSNVVIVSVLLKMVTSFAFGLSFMSLTAAFIVYVKTTWPQRLRAAAVITVAYAAGQSVGPILGGLFNQANGKFTDAILVSGVVICFSLMLFSAAAYQMKLSKITQSSK